MNKLRLLVPLTLAACLVAGLLLALQPKGAQAVSLNQPEPEWYFKPGGWIDYAPNGVPDFDQKQDNWFVMTAPGGQKWTYCGPVAAANSLWWFDSKFEPSPYPPFLPNDYYYLITSYYENIDDHDYRNVGGWPIEQSVFLTGLIDDLACYFKTDQWGNFKGTEVHQMAIGLQEYLYNDSNHPCNLIRQHSKGGSYYDDYHVQLVKMPTWDWVVSEVKRSEDVILLLGFWQQPPTGGPWMRVGGHYVTVSGVDDSTPQIAFSDPFLNMREFIPPSPGDIFSGTLLYHAIPHGASVHNDAGNISRDYYLVNLNPTSPSGLWEIVNYPVALTNQNFVGQNCPDEFANANLCNEYYNPGLLVYVEVEYAIAVSPFDWKAGGEWVSVPGQHGEWDTEWWWYEDDADSCLPDFSYAFGDNTKAFLDGPTALANSLWWFDSKAETLLTGGFPQEPPIISDHYDLVQSYDVIDWDDHHPQNTQHLIETISATLGTTSNGTTKTEMYEGIKQYLDDRGDVAQDFYVVDTEWPAWDWITSEVRTSEDVLMLLGFYERMATGGYDRKGGHWVNAAGVGIDPLNHWIGLSDSQIDNANHGSMASNLYLGRVYPPEQLGTPFSVAEKREPQSISHDIYKVVEGPLATESLALDGYPAESFFDIYEGKNGGGSGWERGDPISTVVEYAIGVSPYSDLVITKTVPITTVGSGGLVTYTIEYANQGLAAVNNLCISDTFPSLLSNIGWNSTPHILAPEPVTCTWMNSLLSYGQGGLITVTGISPIRVPPFNEICITGTTSIGNPTPDRNEDNNCDDAGWYAVYLPAIFR